MTLALACDCDINRNIQHNKDTHVRKSHKWFLVSKIIIQLLLDSVQDMNKPFPTKVNYCAYLMKKIEEQEKYQCHSSYMVAK